MRKLSAIRLTFLSLIFALCASSYQQAQDQPNSSAAAQSSSANSPQSSSSQSSSSKPQPGTVQSGEPATGLESATVLKVTTRLVVLEVVATDAHGHAVLDLVPKDFTVLEEGKEQKVSAFGFQHPVPTDPKFKLPALPPHVFTNIPQFPPASSLNVIVLDALNTTLPNQAYVRDKMLHYLQTMPANQPMAVYTLGQKLRMVQDFTTDPSILKDAVNKVGLRSSPVLDNPGGGPEAKIFPPGYLETQQGITPDMIQAVQDFEAERTSFQTDLRVHYTLDALLAIAHSLAGYQCRKNLIWVTEAFPLSITPRSNISSPNMTFAGTRSYENEITKTAQVLTDSQIAIYPVDARGLMGSDYFNAANDGTDKFGRSLSTGPRMQNALSDASMQLVEAHSAMDSLAEETGGKAYYNRNDIDGAIRDSLNDGSTYYTLGYYPENKDWNGKFRKLKVKVDREGIRLRYRPGYYAADPKENANQASKLRELELNDALNLDHPNSTGLFFRADVWASSEKTSSQVIFNYGIDPHAVVFERGNDGLEHASVDCLVQAYSEKGKLVNSASNTVQSSLKPETYKNVLQSAFPCKNQIELPAGSYLLRLAVRDNRSGLIGTTTGKIALPFAPPQLIRRQ
ncbi:MAG TPA: VWA domain-containing protein [Terriglobales bacterium]|nr:VWA domain-containing protein [Terriglobales bacterium]